MRTGKPRSLICGVGINDWEGFTSSYLKGRMPEYDLWRAMISRCYSSSRKRQYPTYEGVTVSQEFLIFSNFYEFLQSAVGFGNLNWDMDKDILNRRARTYSRETVVFVPKEINYFVLSNGAIRGSLPMGVCFDKRTGKYTASLKIAGVRKNLGRFQTIEGAALAYKIEKESRAKVLAEKWKGEIDVRVYEGLRNYRVEDYS